MKTSVLLFVLPLAFAWTPPIFLDTMESENLQQHESVDDQRELQAAISLKNVEDSPNQPTAGPTESPAPSPSPSEPPTSQPTGTPKPTGTPTITPTESPAPSPSPSKTPTVEPTKGPTGAPSPSPTVSVHPTAAPTISRYPTHFPTPTPTIEPSASPSVSPSSAPTFVKEIKSNHVVKFDFKNPLVITQARAFETATASFVARFPISEGSLSEISVDVLNQIVKTDPNTGSGQQDVQRYLEIYFMVQADYTGKDMEFNLYDLLDSQFQNKNSNWIRGLADENTVFHPLVTSTMNQVDSQTPRSQDRHSNGKTSLSKKSYTSILLVSFLALILAIVASVYAIRSHNLNTFGTELRSPSSQLNKPGVSHSYSSQDVEAKITASTSSDTSGVPAGIMHPPYHGLSLPPQHRQQRQSMSRLPMQSLSEEVETNQDEGHERRVSNLSKMAPPQPPLPPLPLNQKTRKERDPVAKRLSELPEPPAFSEVNFGRNSSLFDRQSIVSDASSETESIMPGRVSNAMAERIAKFERTSDISDDGQELRLTQSRGGTLGAQSVSVPGTSSDFSADAKAFFDKLVKNTSEQIHGVNVAAPRPLSRNGSKQSGPPQHKPVVPLKTNGHTNNRRASYDSVLQKPEVYDVFAPPGPIGIVVDSTDKGPTVHALKNTSPMIGLIAPGDLIVGLDDLDTRGMTAATLTRLMAQKANQKERKITLLTVDA